MNIGGKYLLDSCTFNKINKNVSINISKDMPVKICYFMDEEPGENYIKLYIAPRVE